MRVPHPSAFGFITIWYGKGFDSLVVIGGMWSFSLFTVVTIFIAAFSSMASIAFLTFALSKMGCISSCNFKREGCEPSQLLHTTLGPWGRQRDVQRPLLPAHLFLRLRKPRLLPPPLEELHGHQAPHPAIPRAHIRTRV